jgi:hypothetical protein
MDPKPTSASGGSWRAVSLAAVACAVAGLGVCAYFLGPSVWWLIVWIALLVHWGVLTNREIAFWVSLAFIVLGVLPVGLVYLAMFVVRGHRPGWQGAAAAVALGLSVFGGVFGYAVWFVWGA